MLGNMIIQLDKVKTFVQHSKILHISFTAEGCFIGEPLITSSIMAMKECGGYRKKNNFEDLFLLFTLETAWIYDMCTGILLWFTQFYIKKLPVNEIFKEALLFM
jgi:hypothetical protein